MNSAIKLKRMYGIIVVLKIILEWCLKKYTIKGDFNGFKQYQNGRFGKGQ